MRSGDLKILAKTELCYNKSKRMEDIGEKKQKIKI
jgi:hypothetical protein